MKWKMLFIACLVASTIGVGVYRGSFLSTKSGFEDNFEGFEAPLPRNGKIVPPAPEDREANPQGAQAAFPAPQMVSAYQSQVDECTKKEKEAARLAKEIKANPDPAKEAALRTLLDEVFEQKHAAQEAEVKELSKKLSRLQESLVTRKAKKSEIVTRHIKELQGEPDETAWDVSPRKKEMIVRRGITLEDAYGGGIEENFGPQNRGTRLPGLSLNLQNLVPQVMPVPNPPQSARAISNPATVAEPRRGPQAKDPSVNNRTANVTVSPGDRGTVASADTVPLASQWAALVRALDALKSSSQQQKFANDPKSLELEWELAKVKLREAEETLTSQTAMSKSGAIGKDELRKSSFAVERAKLEAALAEQRLKLATETPKNSPGSDAPKEKSGSGRSARSDSTKILIVEPAEDCAADSSIPVPCEDSQRIPVSGNPEKTNSNPKGEPGKLKTEKSPAKGRACLEIQLNKGDAISHQFILSLVFSLPRISLG